MKLHNAEYIYFHTDHLWTALGAYYAYQVFCIQPHDYKDYETMEFPGFLGTFYSSSNQSPALTANPDTVVAYLPKGTNTISQMVQDYGVQDVIISLQIYNATTKNAIPKLLNIGQ